MKKNGKKAAATEKYPTFPTSFRLSHKAIESLAKKASALGLSKSQTVEKMIHTFKLAA